MARVLGRVTALAAEGLFGRELLVAVRADRSPGHFVSTSCRVIPRLSIGASFSSGERAEHHRYALAEGELTFTLGGREARVEQNMVANQGKW